jgi:hypothetical protein
MGISAGLLAPRRLPKNCIFIPSLNGHAPVAVSGQQSPNDVIGCCFMDAAQTERASRFTGTDMRNPFGNPPH